MFLALLKFAVVIAFLYFLYEKIFKIYYKYFYYKRQGMPITEVPWPLIGTMHTYVNSMKTMDKYSPSELDNHLTILYGETRPPVYIDFRTA